MMALAAVMRLAAFLVKFNVSAIRIFLAALTQHYRGECISDVAMFLINFFCRRSLVDETAILSCLSIKKRRIE